MKRKVRLIARQGCPITSISDPPVFMTVYFCSQSCPLLPLFLSVLPTFNQICLIGRNGEQNNIHLSIFIQKSASQLLILKCLHDLVCMTQFLHPQFFFLCILLSPQKNSTVLYLSTAARYEPWVNIFYGLSTSVNLTCGY